MTSDTEPDKVDPETVEGYEPPLDGETTKERRARKARNRRRAEKVQRETAAAGSTGTGTGPGRPSKQSKRAQSVTGIVTGVGIGVMALDQHDGTVIIEGAADLGDALAKVADKSPKVAKALDALTETSAWAEVAVALGGIVIPIATHHGLGLASLRKAPAPDLDVDPAPEHVEQPAAKSYDVDGFNVGPVQVDADAPVFTVKPDDAADAVPTFRAQA